MVIVRRRNYFFAVIWWRVWETMNGEFDRWTMIVWCLYPADGFIPWTNISCNLLRVSCSLRWSVLALCCVTSIKIDWPWGPWLPWGLELNSWCSASCISWSVANSFTRNFCTYSTLASFNKPFLTNASATSWRLSECAGFFFPGICLVSRLYPYRIASQRQTRLLTDVWLSECLNGAWSLWMIMMCGPWK